jgi:hypothetical protein
LAKYTLNDRRIQFPGSAANDKNEKFFDPGIARSLAPRQSPHQDIDFPRSAAILPGRSFIALPGLLG